MERVVVLSAGARESPSAAGFLISALRRGSEDPVRGFPRMSRRRDEALRAKHDPGNSRPMFRGRNQVHPESVPVRYRGNRCQPDPARSVSTQTSLIRILDEALRAK